MLAVSGGTDFCMCQIYLCNSACYTNQDKPSSLGGIPYFWHQVLMPCERGSLELGNYPKQLQAQARLYDLKQRRNHKVITPYHQPSPISPCRKANPRGIIAVELDILAKASAPITFQKMSILPTKRKKYLVLLSEKLPFLPWWELIKALKLSVT